MSPSAIRKDPVNGGNPRRQRQNSLAGDSAVVAAFLRWLQQVSGARNAGNALDANGSFPADGRNQFIHDARERLILINKLLGRMQYAVNALGGG